MRHWIAIAALAFAAPAMAVDLEIKGVKVDEPADCRYIGTLETRSGTFYGGCEKRSPQFATEVSFLSGTHMMMVSQTPEGLVTAVNVIGFKYTEALDALTLKYGPPALERSTIQNRMGATFDQEVATWTDGPRSLILRKHGGKIDSPGLMLIGETFGIASKAERTRKAADGARNL